MARETIDFGIDLGTTNSAVAVTNATTVKVFRNAEGWEYTPSAVWEDKNQNLLVGRLAKERLESDSENAHCEFKLQMGATGANAERIFAGSGRRMTPEQLSAEVLKVLRKDVERDCGEMVDAAVITVPAAFELAQCNATRTAAELAGFKQCVLLQEPVAAALAYLENFKGEQGYWLVFDFGGGTFDAAVIQLRDGSFECIAHKGDNALGGKLIDWDIVNQLFIPTLTREYRLADFRRGNGQWLKAISKLKLKAEEAKIGTTVNPSMEVTIDFVCQDDAGRPVGLNFELKRQDVERLCEAYVLRAIDICGQALREAKLGPDGVESVLLVGGPTLMPYFRRMLADPKAGLGIPLDFSQDPLTVVARGAARFARRQRRTVKPTGEQAKAQSGQLVIDLHYKPVGPETDPIVSGRIVNADGQTFAGYTIEFTNTTMRPSWRSGRIGLSPEGSFLTNLEAEKGPENLFTIELSDSHGNRRPASPDRLTYLVDVGVREQPVINSIGVALMGNKFFTLLKKGTSLPARNKRKKFITGVDIKRGQPVPPIVIIMEGDSRRADRNKTCVEIKLPPEAITRDLPAGSEVEVTVEMDESRYIRAKALVCEMDQEFEAELDWTSYQQEANNPAGLRREFEAQTKRLKEARQKAREMDVDKAEKLLLKIDADRIISEIENLLGSATDNDAAITCRNRILDLTRSLDRVEDILEWPGQVEQARKEVNYWKGIIDDDYFKASTVEKSEFRKFESDIRRLLENDTPSEADKLKDLLAALDDLGYSILVRSPAYWVNRFKYLEKQVEAMTNPQQAQAFLDQGRRAMKANDFESLQSAVRQLSALLPRNLAETQGPILIER
jgi:molecular chaperone DnaK